MLLLSLLLFDLWQACRTVYKTYWFLVECTVAGMVGLSAVACFVKYLWLWCGGDQVIGTDYQKFLLDGKDGKDGFPIPKMQETITVSFHRQLLQDCVYPPFKEAAQLRH